MIYFDQAATSWPKPECVYEAVNYFLRHVPGNFGRGHHEGTQSAQKVLFETRNALKDLLGAAKASEIAFTYNATDALNMALFGLVQAGQIVVTTSMEHNAVTRPLKVLQDQGVVVKVVPCNSEGELNGAAFKEALSGASFLILSHASNVTGQVRNLDLLLKEAKQQGVVTIVDAAQTAGLIPIHVQQQQIDVLACSGHKGLWGPQGTGLLYVREDLTIKPFRYGGTGSQSERDEQPSFRPDRLESGTLNGPGLAGLGAGVRELMRIGVENISCREQQLRQKLYEGLKENRQIAFYGLKGTEHTGVLALNIKDRQDKVLESTEMAYYLNEDYEIACRAGLHCAPWTHSTLGTLQTGIIRLSVGWFTTEEEIDTVVKAVWEISKKNY